MRKLRSSPFASPDVDPGRVVTTAVVRVADRLELSARALSSIVGLSEASISRLKSGGLALTPGTKPFELALLLVRLYRSLDGIVGGDDTVARAWLRAPNTALDASPIEKLSTITGLVDVVAYLDARRAVV